ncbi:Candidapepsin-8 [Trichoderma ghanense]|uniref:Candidapepsin-8 n=1 Tax=Trichoderma ghanense TaxID=65468 RepID=A0ABY2HGE7_9HYPO
MAISSFLVLSLALLAHARPKHAFEPEDLGHRITLPVIPASPSPNQGATDLSQRSAADQQEDKPFHILPYPYPSKRDVDSRQQPEEEDKPFHILPYPYPSKRSAESSGEAKDGEEGDKPFHILPYPYPNKRSILEDDEGAAGGMTLPVPLGEHDLPFLKEKRKLPADDVPSGAFTLPIIHARRPKLASRAIEVQVENRSDVSYYAQLNIGTPPQTVYAQIDTGSFELWVNPNCTNVQSADQRFCRAIGFYDPSSSSTADVTSQSARLRYGIGSADVTYVRDTIALSSSSTAMKAVQFGVADTSVDEFSGILGIGAGQGFNTDYPNFVDELAAQGVTATKAFSLALGSKAEEEGVIIFGGVDTAKFHGELAHLPIVPADDSPDGVARYWVKMKSISLTPPSDSADDKPVAFPQTSMTVFLDSGSTLTLLPPQLVRQIASALGSTQTDESGFFVVDCALASQDGTIDFEFDGVTIRVPYAEMIRQVSTLPPHCYLGMMGSTQFALLGDTFLRSAYAVFDLTSNVVHLAPYANCGTNVKSITSTSSLSNLVGACNDPSNSPSSPSKSPSSSPAPSSTTTTKKVASKTSSPTAVSPSATSSSSSSAPAPSSPTTTVNVPSPSSAVGQPKVLPSVTQASSGGAETTAAAAAAAATSAAKGSSTTTGVVPSQTGGTNGAGRMGVRGFALSVVVAAMGFLLV